MIGGPCHVDTIAVVLALEDYHNSIAKNLRVRDVAVDIYMYGVAMVSHQTGGGGIFFHRAGEGIYLFTRQGERFFFHFFIKAKQYKLINEDLVSGGSRI